MPELRSSRLSDSAGIADLIRRNPSEEFPLMGLNPEQLEGIVRRLHSGSVRLILALSAAVGRPLVKIVVLEDGGSILGIAMVSFSPGVARIGGLTVDSSVRRRGHAQELMRACERLARKYRRSHLVLEVLSTNTPAIRLYEKLGYRTLRDVRWMSRDLTQPLVARTANERYRLRAFRRSDARELVALANDAMPDSVRSRARFRSSDFRVAGLSRRAGGVEATSWVVERESQIVGYAKAFVSPALAAAQIDPLVLAAPAASDACERLTQAALGWCTERRAPRAILALPDHLDGLRPTLEGDGFTEGLRLHTMALDLGASPRP